MTADSLNKTRHKVLAAIWLILGFLIFFMGVVAGKSIIINQPYTFLVLFLAFIPIYGMATACAITAIKENK